MAALKIIMDTLAARLKAAGYKNVYAFPTSPVETPGVVIGYPTEIDFDMTFGDGGDNFTIPVFFLVGKALTEQARDSVSDVLHGGRKVKTILEASPLGGTTNRVEDANVETVTVGGVDYLSATFTVDIKTQNG